MPEDFSDMQEQETGETQETLPVDMKQGERNRLAPIMADLQQPDAGARMHAGEEAVDAGLRQVRAEGQSRYDMAVQHVRATQGLSEHLTPGSIEESKAVAKYLGIPYQAAIIDPVEAKKEYVIRRISEQEYAAQWAGSSEENASYARTYLDTVVDFFKDTPNWKEWGDSLMHWLVFDSGKAVERFGLNLAEGAATSNKAFVDFGRMFAENVGLTSAAQYLGDISKSLDRYKNLAEQYGVGRPKEEKAGALWDEFVKSVPQQVWNLASLALFKRPVAGTLKLGAGGVVGAEAAMVANPLLAEKAGSGMAGMAIMGAQIAGGSYGELREQGVSPMTAGVASLGNAMMQAPFEKFGLESFVDIFKAKGMREALYKALGSIFSEGGTEYIQKWPEYLAHTWAQSELHGKTAFDRANWFVQSLFDPKNIRQAHEEAMLEAAVGAMWGGLGGGVRIAMTHQQQERARQVADFLYGIRQHAQQAVQKGMPPEVVKSMVEAAQPLMASTAYVDAEQALTLYQSGNDAVLEGLGVSEEELVKLADEGGAVPIQLSDLVTRVDDATFDALYQHASIRPGAMTVGEAGATPESNPYTRSALAAARRQANQIPGVSTELSRLYHELLDAGVTRTEAREDTTLLAVQAATLQAKGMDALSWLKRRKYVVGENGSIFTAPTGLPKTEGAELVSSDVRDQIASSMDRDALQKMYFANQQAIEAAGENAQERDRLQAVNRMVEARIAMLNELEQRGWHGSGRRGIRQFDLRHAGEGEGGAAHGHGVYVAQAKGIANGYRIMAAGPDYTYNGRSLTDLREDLNKQKDFDKLEIVDDFMLKQNAEEMDWDDYDEDAAEWFRGEVLPNLEGKGQVYEVEVPENDVLLDEQATLENQPEAVKQAVQAAVDEMGIDPSGVGRDIYSAISGTLGSDRQASEWLSEHGVKGITYVGERDGRAFVVFAGEDVSIVGTMFQGDGPAPDAEVVGGPTLYQVQNLPEWKERLRKWGEDNSIEKAKIEAFIAGIEGQMKLIESLQTKDGLNLSDAIMREVVGAGQANRKKKSGGVAYSGPVRSNADEIYLISFDASSMCVKRLSAAKTAQEAQKELGRPLTVDEQLALIALYRAEGKEAPCIYCYVESNRRKATQAVGVARDILSGTTDLPGRWGKQRKEKAQAAIDEFKAAGLTREDVIADYVLDPAVGNTEEALAAKQKYPAIYDFMNSEALATKQNQVKLYEEYSGNLLDMTPEQVEMLNGYAGIRFFSSSDFQIEHMVDLMQAFTDMAAMGAKSHAYTKVPLYVDIFGDTGQKINLSCFAEEDPETGEIRPDVAQGWDWEKAKEMRAAHPDCGVVLVASSDKILRWAMQQDWIDYIIPFHYSGLEKKYYETLGWQDFTSIQMETKIKGFKKKKVQQEDENELIGKNVGWPKVYELEREKTTAEASVEYAQMCFDRQTYPVRVEYVFTDLANDESLKTNKRRDLARERWAAMVESKKFDASQINPEYFKQRQTAGKTTKDKPMRPNGIKRVRMHEVTNPSNEKDIKGISDGQGTRTYLEICKERGLYPVFPNFCFKEEVFAELHAKYADELSKAKTKEDKAKVIAKRRREEIKLAKDLWKEMVLKGSIDWDKIDLHAFKFKKDYARTDTDFNVVDPSKIHMDKAAEPLQDTISQGLNEKYQSDPSIVKKLVTLARWGEANGKPIGQPALAAARAKKDPMSAIMGGPAYPTAYKMPNTTEGITLNQSAVDEETARRDEEYMQAVEAGDMEKARAMVEARAREKGFDNAIPEHSDSYHIRTKPAPQKTKKAYKVFYVNPQTGAPTALFVGGAEDLPVGTWLDANDQWHFTADNGKQYVPSTKNPNRTDLSGKKKNKTTGKSVPIPDDPAVRQYLLEHGFITEKSKSVTGLAYRPGWHAGTLPFFPQGGKKQEGSNYGNVHEHNQVVFEIEIAADTDWTEFARSQDKAKNKDGSINNRNADLQQLPTDGFYTYTTNPILDPKEGAWVISDSIKIVRALSQDEADSILKENGKLPQEWEQGQLNLEDYGLDTEVRSDEARKTLAPVTYDKNGNVIPLSKRFDASNPSVLYAGSSSSPRGSYTRTAQGEDLIRIFQGQDVSTVQHEGAHAYHQALEDLAKDDGSGARQGCYDSLVQAGVAPELAEAFASMEVEQIGNQIAAIQSQIAAGEEQLKTAKAEKDKAKETGKAELNAQWKADKAMLQAQIDALTQLRRHLVGIEQARQDLRTIREWVGVPVEGELTREQYIKVQEQFARGYEGYLATGKAPTAALAGVFARFKQWLLSVYKNIRDYVGADITPEIKDVYDRMLATEEEMQADELVQSCLGAESDALAMLGISASESAYLEDMLIKAHMAASSRVDKERAKDRKKRYKAAYDMALSSLVETPLWRLATGGYGKINYESLKEYLGDKEANELRKRLPKTIVSGDGSTIDVIAMGFDDEMIANGFGGNADDVAQMLYEHIVLNGEKLKDEAKALADQAMASEDAEYSVEDGFLAGDEYGAFLDALEDAALEVEAKASAKGKAKVEAKEEKARRLQAVAAERRARWDEYQRRAKEELDATPVGQIDPKRYASMLRKALKGKDNALLSKDTDKVVQAVQKARYAFALMREAKRRQDMVEKNLRMMQRLLRKKPGDLAPLPATALARMLKLYGFREPKRWSGDPDFDNMTMQAIMEACVQESQGVDATDVMPDLAEWVLQEGLPDYAKDNSWQSLTWADYNDLMDAFNFFVHSSKEQNKNNKDSMKARVDALVEDSLETMKDLKTLSNASEGSALRKLQTAKRWIMGAIQALQWQFRKADGFSNAGPKGKAGALEAGLMRPILEAEGKFKSLMKDITNRLIGESNSPLNVLRKTAARLEADYGNGNGELIKLTDANGKAIVLPDAIRQYVGRSAWTSDQVIALALNAGNSGNRQRITGGYPDLDYNTLAAILGSDMAAKICTDNGITVPEDAPLQHGILTAEDWAAIQGVWDTIETLWPDTVGVHRSMYGFAPRRVDVEPMTFRAGGQEIALRGGYYPIYYDKDLSLDAQRWGEKDDIVSTTESFFPAPAAKRGHTKSRQAKTSHPLRLSTSTLMEHIQDAAKLICFAEPVRFADKVTQNKAFAAEYVRCFGMDDYKAIRPNLKGCVRSEPAPKDALVKLSNAMRKYIVPAGLWGNLKVALLQTTALGPAMGDLGAGPVISAMGRIVAGGGWSYIKKIQEVSPYMRSRWKAFDQDLLDRTQGLDIHKRPKSVKIGNREISWDDVVNAGMTPLAAVDLVTSGAIWQAAYTKAMKDFGAKGASSIQQESDYHTQAVQIADEAVKKSNPDFDPSSRSAFLRAQNSFRLVNAFGSAVTLMAQRSEYMWQAMRHGRISKMQLARYEAYEYFVPALAMTLILATVRGIWGDDDDDEKKLTKLFFDSLLDQYSMKAPVVGGLLKDTVSATFGGSTGGRQPTMRTTYDTVWNMFYRAPISIAKAIEEPSSDNVKKMSYNIGDIVSFVARVPVAKLIRNIERGEAQRERGEGTYASWFMPAPGK